MGKGIHKTTFTFNAYKLQDKLNKNKNILKKTVLSNFINDINYVTTGYANDWCRPVHSAYELGVRYVSTRWRCS